MSNNQNANMNEVEVKNENVVQSNINEQKKINLLNVKIDNENIALNILIGFINIAQKRGCYSINESAKIHECIQMFMKKP